MADLEGVPQWKRDLIRRRRAGQQSQSAARRGHADMLLQSPASYDLTDNADCSEDGSNTERSTPLRDAIETHTDSGEELTYGPGIVKKLKSRYLSLTLREVNKTRPSLHGLRRATSLEHVLEDEKPAPPPRKYQPVATSTNRQTRYRQPTRAPDAVRRARSVDALARCDLRSETEDRLSLIERESPTNRETPQPPPLPSPTLRPKRPAPLLKDAERPPPDLVKQALKIFEGQPGKKLRAPCTGQVADKVKSFSETQKQTKKTNGARLPRPAVPPRGPLLSPEHKNIPVATQTTPSLLSRPPPSPKKFVNNKTDKERSISPVYVNKHPVIYAPVDTSPVKTVNDLPVLKSIKPLDLKSPEISPRNSLLKSPDLVSPREKSLREVRERNGNEKDPYIRTSTPDPEVLSQPATTEISLISPTSPRPRKLSDRITSDSSSEDEGSFDLHGDDEPPKTKVVDRSSLDKISKASTTTQFSFSNGFNNGELKKSYLPSAKQNSSVNNTKSESVISNSFSKSNSSNPSKVPDLIQTSSKSSSAALAAKPITVADTKLINSILAPKYNNDNAAQSISFDAVTSCPTLPIKEPRAAVVSLDVRRAKDIESSPALVHYDSPSPPVANSAKSVNNKLTSREIEKNLINASKSLQEVHAKSLQQENSPEFVVNVSEAVEERLLVASLEQPVKKVTVSVLDSPDKAKVNNKIVNNSNSENNLVFEVEETLTSVVSDSNGDTVGVIATKESRSVVSESSAMSNGVVVVGNKLGSGRKPQWHQQEATTMLFDFSKRKGVPDYIENDGIIRRNRPKVGVGVISIDGLGGESCTDGTSDSEDDWTKRPPSPCDVAFENDNVVINGRSNMSAGKPRSRHLKIQFDESLTTTFEYPSEASLGEDHFSGTNASSSPASPIATGGPLSSYTPSKVTLQADTFQLGVTRSHVQTSEKNGNGSMASTNGDVLDASNSSSNGTSSSSSEDRKIADEPYLKPCQEDQSHNWSHETHVGDGDLLF